MAARSVQNSGSHTATLDTFARYLHSSSGVTNVGSHTKCFCWSLPITMFLLDLKRGVLVMIRSSIVAGKTAVLWPHGRNEDRWPDIAPAARVMRALSESAALGSSLLSVVGWVVLAAIA
jgi:hypothetical protein